MKSSMDWSPFPSDEQLWWASIQRQLWRQPQNLSLALGCQGHQKALNPRAQATNSENWRKTSKWDRIEIRVKKKKQKNKTPTKIPLLPAAPCRMVLSFRLCSLCSGFTGFPQPPVLLSEWWLYPQNVACPSLWWDMNSLTNPFLLWMGQGCLQINSSSWKWAKLELYSRLGGCVRLHTDCIETISSFSQPQLTGMFMSRCCRRVLAAAPTGVLPGQRKGVEKTCLLEQH